MVAFIILNYNTWEMTLRCVESIDQTCKQDYTIYIVDNGSTNESYRELKEKYLNHKKVIVIENKNLGYARGNNVGIRQAMQDGHDFIAVTNNDVIFLEDSIEQMYKFLEGNQDAAVAAPYILSPEGILHNLPVLKPENAHDYLLFHTRLDKFVSKNRKLQYHNELTLTSNMIGNQPIPIYKFSGCCFMAKREMFEDIGLLDEHTFLYFEEDILCHKMYQSGYKAYFLPDSKIVHHHGLTTGKDNLFIDTEMLKSELYFLTRILQMNFTAMFFIYLDRALTSMVKILRKKYHNVTFKDFFTFLRKTWTHFRKVRSNRL